LIVNTFNGHELLEALRSLIVQLLELRLHSCSHKTFMKNLIGYKNA
jgi:hypothetical protein